MTLETELVGDQAPKPRPKPTARRRPAPARHANGTVDALAEMQKQIAELTARVQGGMQTVEAAPANLIGKSRVADREELTEWQLRVRDKTEPTPRDLERREKNYNYDSKLYMKPDGTVVSLQGDPQNFAYYTDKKRFHALSDAETREYVTVERPKIVRFQMQKASLINTIRRAIAVDPALAAGLDPSWDTDLDRMTIPELQAQVDEIAGTPTAGGQKRRMMSRLQRLTDADNRAAEDESKRMLEGVETTPSRTALEAFEGSLPTIPRRSHDIEITPRNAAQFRGA